MRQQNTTSTTRATRPKSAHSFNTFLHTSKSQKKIATTKRESRKLGEPSPNQFISKKNSEMKNTASPTRDEFNNFQKNVYQRVNQDIDPMLLSSKKVKQSKKTMAYQRDRSSTFIGNTASKGTRKTMFFWTNDA